MWISVEDHLPDDEEEFSVISNYIATVQGRWFKYVQEVCFNVDDRKWYLPCGGVVSITHWMHMPEPAEG